MIVKTYCARMDHGGCGILAHVVNGKLTKIEGDPDSPISKGYICAKGLAQIERLNHPDRLLYPMKRMGEKGEGKWKPISWDEALETIAGKIKETIERDGEKALSFAHPEACRYALPSSTLVTLAFTISLPQVHLPAFLDMVSQGHFSPQLQA